MTDEPTTPPPLGQSLARPGPPPLRVVHLLLYMAVSSVYLAFVTLPQIRERVTARLPASGFQEQWRVRLTLEGLVYSATITICILLVIWWLRGWRVWDQPGHWIALWVSWDAVSLHCVRQVVALAKSLAGVQSADDMLRFWEWAKGLYALQYLPFAILFLCLAIGWRGVANTWPWRLFFASAAVWLLLVRTPGHLPFDWRAVITTLPVALVWFLILHGRTLSLASLLMAIANDLLPGRPRRHWSHWVPACHLPLIMLTYLLSTS